MVNTYVFPRYSTAPPSPQETPTPRATDLLEKMIVPVVSS